MGKIFMRWALNTPCKVLPEDWDAARSAVTTKQQGVRTQYIESICERIRQDLERLAKIDKRLDAKGLPYTADDVMEQFRRYTNEYTLCNYMRHLISNLKQNGKLRTSETYAAALRSFRNFITDRATNTQAIDKEDIMLDTLTSELMEAYEAWHKATRPTPSRFTQESFAQHTTVQ